MCNEVYNFVAKISKVEGFKREKIWIRTGYFFFFLSSALRVLLFFSFSPAAAPTRSLAPTHLPLRKPRISGFALLCSSPPAAPALWGRIALVSGKKQPLIPLFFLELAWAYSKSSWFLQFSVDCVIFLLQNCRQLLPLPGPVLQLENCGMWQLL
ncbi:hypothetical protein SLEP1_g39462 [Rubroshorea leprosula]|uniref:Uncharacterized protein n=1 Tax=Rubroshorea leprosula TaxID=152421 RepID=A0AAV5L0X2_9ROSI|nr:hypothetical protein SLEP1_g39462 [Rubroshorea leprosula]